MGYVIEMTFEHENTWFKALNSGKVEDFHSNYEEALKKVKNEFGKTCHGKIEGWRN